MLRRTLCNLVFWVWKSFICTSLLFPFSFSSFKSVECTYVLRRYHCKELAKRSKELACYEHFAMKLMFCNGTNVFFVYKNSIYVLSTWILKIVVKHCFNEIDSVLRYDYIYDETLIAIRHVQFFIDLFFMQKTYNTLSQCNMKKTEEN